MTNKKGDKKRQKGDKTDTVTNKKGDKTGDKGRQKRDKADTMTNKKGDKKGRQKETEGKQRRTFRLCKMVPCFCMKRFKKTHSLPQTPQGLEETNGRQA